MVATTLTIYYQEKTLSSLSTFYYKRTDIYTVYSDSGLTIPVGNVTNNIQRINYNVIFNDTIYNMDKTFLIGDKIFRLDHVENQNDLSINVPLKYYNKWDGITAIGYAFRTYLPNNVSQVVFTTYQ